MLKKLLWFYKVFIAPPKIWTLPLKSEVILFHSNEKQLISKYLKNFSFQVLALDGFEINYLIFIRSIFSPLFWAGRPDKAYFTTFIDTVKPKLILTFIDNDPMFYQLSSSFKGIKFALLQNGIRYPWIEHDSTQVRLKADFMFIHNGSIGGYYQSHIEGKIFEIGSFKNNAAPLSHIEKSNEVLFVSQYQAKCEEDPPIVFGVNGQPYRWDSFYKIEDLLLSHLDKWCFEKKKTLRICGRLPAGLGGEYEYYRQRLNKVSWIYDPGLPGLEVYNLIDRAQVVVTVDSTLGYESLARGTRTAFFSGRGNFVACPFRRFGWPASISDVGPFWTSSITKEEVYRVMDYLAGESDAQWQKTCQTYAPQVMRFDPGNTILQSTLQHLLTSEQLKYA